ncbi:hypothetical protein HY410_01260 [Candidatus Gottesmanbacteria bacterium]|nr:hypothetical protein [Candidatus Gottesmanbacteria bacterium]
MLGEIEVFYGNQMSGRVDELGARMFAIGQTLNPVNLAEFPNWGETTASEIAKFMVGQSPQAASYWRKDRHDLRALERNRDNIGSQRVEQVLVQIGVELRKVVYENKRPVA